MSEQVTSQPRQGGPGEIGETNARPRKGEGDRLGVANIQPAVWASDGVLPVKGDRSMRCGYPGQEEAG